MYNWNLSGGGTIIDPNNSNLIHINWILAGGPYVLSVTETNVDGCTGEPVTLLVNVNAPSVAGVTISTLSNLSCDGLPVTFNAAPASGGTAPFYTWFVNGIARPNPGPSTFTYLPAHGDTVQVTLNSSSLCALPNPVWSDSIIMMVGLASTPSISILADNNPSCTGNTVVFSSDTSQAGNMPLFQWKKNGTIVGTNSPTYSDNALVTNDVISCILVSDAVCASPASDTSNLVTMSVNPTPLVTVSPPPVNPSVCGASDGSISLSGLIPGTSYLVNYNFNGIPVSKTLSAGLTGVLVLPNLTAGNYGNITVLLGGCSSVAVTENLSDPGATAAPNIVSNINSVCPGEVVGLSASGCSGTITWSNGLSGANVYVTPADTTTYTATCNFNGCTSAPSNSVVVNVKARPLIVGYNVTPPTTFCSTDGIITLTGLMPNTAYTSYFTYDAVQDSLLGNTLANGWYQISGCKPTTYFYLTVKLDGCKSDSLDVVVPASTLPQPPSITSADDTVCPGQTVILTAQGCSGLVTWSDGTTGPTLTTTLAASSDFSATCTVNLCKSASGSPLTITVAPAEFETISGNSHVCEKGTLLLNALGNAVIYHWTLPDGSSYTKQNYQKDTVAVSDSGTYRLVSTDIKGCSDTDSIDVVVNTPPLISISAEDTLCAGTVHYLQAGAGFSSYMWQDNSNLSSFPAKDEGIYWVLITDGSGCKASDTAWLTYCPAEIYIPTAFSPNNIGKNERFRPVCGGIVLLEYKMVVYSRWGQKIFESNDYVTGWDGTMNGSPVPAGSYSYIMSFRTSDPAKPGTSGKETRRGTVLLVR
jgi:gliding motility-associated-like protein